MVPSSERDQDNVDLLVHAYVDGELDIATALAIQRRIEADPSIGDQAADVLTLQTALRSKFPSEPLPPHLKRRIEGRLESKKAVRRRPTWAAMAASLIVAIALSSTSTWLAMRSDPSSALTSELVDSHLRSLIAPQPADIASSDRHTVKPWFNGKVTQSPRVKDLADAGYPLVGGRVDVLDKLAVPTLIYTRRLHVISLTAVPSDGNGTVKSVVNGFNILRWSDEGISYWAISDLNAAELAEFAKLYRQPP
jgi:anti-sigma factor RsiW